SWRPDLWSTPLHPTGLTNISPGTRITSDTALFHDCDHREITFRQTCLPDASAHGFETKLEVLSFSGSYLSLAIDLPEDAIDGLTRDHIVGLAFTLNR
ncbi:MAG: hypothetical protein HKP37_02940, partial [Boseongicola sp.]|nr:hypothetical protein [Boseongicola sp.]